MVKKGNIEQILEIFENRLPWDIYIYLMQKDYKGRTPLIIVVQDDDLDKAKVLLEAEKDPILRTVVIWQSDVFGNNVLDYAKSEEMIALLKSYLN